MRLLLIDAAGYLFRAYHAVPDFRTRDNVPTGAIFGTLNMLEKLRRDYPAERVACVMDAPGKTFRHKMDSAYKANRPPMPPDLKSQIAPLKEFITAFGWQLVVQEGVEADDVIATLSRQGVQAGMDVIIASADKDLMQLAGGGVLLYDGMKEQKYDAAGVRKKFNVLPPQMADYLALVGDSSDNIPGVVKVGAKTAAKWLNEYGDLPTIITAADNIKGVVGENLRAAIASGRLDLSRRLVTLKDDVSLPLGVSELTPRKPDIAAWRGLCERYEFNRLSTALDNMPTVAAPPPAKEKTPIEIISDAKALARWVSDIRVAGTFAVDTETDGEEVMRASLVGFSLALANAAAYVPLMHNDLTATQMSKEEALAQIRPVLEDAAIIKILHNGKYDWHIFANNGVQLKGVLEDTKIAAYVANAATDTKMDALAGVHLNRQTIKYQDVVDGKNVKNFADVPVAAAAAYAAEDADITHRLHEVLIKNLPPAAATVYSTLDRPLMPLLARMEHTGMKINAEELQHFAADMRRRMDKLEARAHEIAGESFNLNSPRQLEVLLFDKLGATPLRKTGGGARSTDERTLERLADDFPLAAVVHEHRMLAKLVGTYAEKLPLSVLPHTGRVHTTFAQTAVMSGRLSSNAPNLQNIPIRTEEGRRIRRAFIADDGYLLVSADYSQVELRVMAHIANDVAMCAAFASGADIHRQTAAEVFAVPVGKVSGEQRRAAKAINFGLIYGMSSFGLARNISITQQQARVYIDRYFNRYPGIAAFMEKTRKEAVDRGYVETILGRRIPLPLSHGNRAAAERVAINAPIQGSAADLVKMAMLAVDNWLRDNNMRSRLILQVHDELVLEAAVDEADALCAELPRLMMGVAHLAVRLESNINRGTNWDEAH